MSRAIGRTHRTHHCRGIRSGARVRRCIRSSERAMRSTSIALFLTIPLSVTAPARASSTCLSALTADQLRELDLMLFPAHPYSAHLSEAVDDDAAQGAVR